MANDSVNITPPPPNPHNIQATKYYIFNQTGNIMLSSTVDTNEPIAEAAQKVFAEVAVFFAAMTKAIASTPNPNAPADQNGNHPPYSVYSHEALQAVIDKSGLFVQVTEEDVEYKTQSVGLNFSKALLEALLGLATGAGELAFASALVASVGKEGFNISEDSSRNDTKVGNVIFVCEYLLGMPIVSALVIYLDAKEMKQQLQIGPCFKEQATTSDWKFHKDTYLFVPPALVQEYAPDLDKVISDQDYEKLVDWLKGLLSPSP